MGRTSRTGKIPVPVMGEPNTTMPSSAMGGGKACTLSLSLGVGEGQGKGEHMGHPPLSLSPARGERTHHPAAPWRANCRVVSPLEERGKKGVCLVHRAEFSATRGTELTGGKSDGR